MAMTACSECKAAISTTAVACPHCGAKAAVLGNSSGIAILVAALFAAGLGSVMFIAILKTPTPPQKTAAQIKAKQVDEAHFQADVIKLRSLKASLKNPASFELVSAGRLSDGTLCATYRGTNSFNAVTTEYMAITAAGAYADYNVACAGKSGQDLSHIRHALTP